MITVKIMGGLGNQMFQYAAGAALAKRLGAPLRLDLSEYSRRNPRHFGLHHFSLASTEYAATKPLFFQQLQSLVWKYSAHTYFESGFEFNEAFNSLSDNVYLVGYWQSEKYFYSYSQFIRDKFVISTPPSTPNARMLEQISSSPSVSLHVRRGDYVANPAANQVHGTCSLDYYVNALTRLKTQISDELSCYIFSDDPEWVQANLKLDANTIYVTHNNDATNYEDLRLMSACQHNIIANSSFSWWGAWLNSYPQKIVFAPNKWFNDTTKNTKDLLPATWIKL